MTRVWVALLHPLIVLVGAMGVFAARAAVAPGAAFCGLVFFLLWAGTEAVQQSLTLVTLNWTWRTEYLQTADAAARDVLGQYLQAFEAVSDGLFFFILIAFVVANVAYAMATWGGDSLQRTVAVGFGLAAGLGRGQRAHVVRSRRLPRYADGRALPAAPAGGAPAHRRVVVEASRLDLSGGVRVRPQDAECGGVPAHDIVRPWRP